jgi:hypothetical protein
MTSIPTHIKNWLGENGIIISSKKLTNFIFAYNNKEMPIRERIELIYHSKDPLFLNFMVAANITHTLYVKPPDINREKYTPSKCNKAIFRCKSEAERKINILNSLGVGKKKSKQGLRAYPCGKCNGWHLTSKPSSGREY